MRFLVDNSVSWRVARDLRVGGHDAVHIADLGLAAAEDRAVYERSVSEGRVLITQDSDFSAIHASVSTRTGVILLRLSSGKPSAHSSALRDNLATLEPALASEAFVVIEDTLIRLSGPID